MNKIVVALSIIVAVAVVVGGYLWIVNSFAPQESNIQPAVGGNRQAGPATHIVTYTDDGFTPALTNIKQGDTVVFKNESAREMWVASAMHPSHILYSGTALEEHCPDANNESFDQCKADGPGTSWSFTFKKTGTWAYHDHMNAKYFGRVVVE